MMRSWPRDFVAFAVGCGRPASGNLEALRQWANNSTWIAYGQLVRRNILYYHAPGSNHCVVPNAHAWADDATSSEPDIVPDGDCLAPSRPLRRVLGSSG